MIKRIYKNIQEHARRSTRHTCALVGLILLGTITSANAGVNCEAIRPGMFWPAFGVGMFLWLFALPWVFWEIDGRP